MKLKKNITVQFESNQIASDVTKFLKECGIWFVVDSYSHNIIYILRITNNQFNLITDYFNDHKIKYEIIS